MPDFESIQLPVYKGREAKKKDRHKHFQRDGRVPRYIAAEPLREVVNLAIHLGRPLLLEGEPGCGKTTLAQHVAWTLDAPYFEWHVKSTDEARRGLYSFDTVLRLADAQLGDKADPQAAERLKNPARYVTLGPLGEAFQSRDRPAVVLIDEVDKADVDFPNDLLLELDQMRFVIHELGNTSREAHLRPLVIVTSNRQKPLPAAFLRRCLYHYIGFPEPDVLEQIIKAHGIALDKKVLEEALVVFVERRKLMKRQAAEKVPDVAELLDWLRALNYLDIRADQLRGKLQAAAALLKTEADRKTFEQES